MKIDAMHIGMQVLHPQHGLGTVKALTEQNAQILFNEGTKTIDPSLSDLKPAEAQVQVSGLNMPLESFLASFAESIATAVGLEKPDGVVEGLAARWHHGLMILRPSNPELQPKEIPLEAFFHKIVMMRNNFRVLEQKINSHEGLSDADKVELQQYITRCYGSLTTFNVLFRHKEDQFTTKE